MQLFLVCDMDMTLIHFNHPLALLKLKTYLDSLPTLSPSAAQAIVHFLNDCRENLRAKDRGLPYDQEIVGRIEEMAYSVPNKGDLDMSFSRELWLYAASNLLGGAVLPQFAVVAADEYWKAIGRFGCLYEDVKEFFASPWWKERYWNLVVVTSSDLRLRASEDGKQLVYDPDYSCFKKLVRIPVSLRQIATNNLFIGDPFSKPHPAFWERVTMNIAYNPEEDVAVMIGDVPKIDLVGLPRGFVPILIDRDKQWNGDAKLARSIIPSFDALPSILERIEAEVKERR